MGEGEIEEVIALLAEAGAIDDASFARRYAEDKRQLAGWGPDRIAKALAGRGVARGHVEAALGGDDEASQLERAIGLLVRRGYPLELAYEAVRAAERRSREAA